MQRAVVHARKYSIRRRLATALAASLALLGSASRAEPLDRPAPPALAGQVVHANPALWVVRRGATTVYLFGTFHTLDARTAWFDDGVRAAFDRSGELVLETVVPDDPAVVRAIAARHVTASPVPARGAPLKPYFAQTGAVLAAGRQAGLRVDHGADAVLRRVALMEGKPVGGLERFEDQLSALATIPMAPRPVPGLLPAPRAPTLADLLEDWTGGDTEAFAATIASLKQQSPEAYRILIADRNARWGEWIEARLDRPGTVFVAVGTGHLAGPDSVQAWLAARGVTATRIG